MNLRQLVLLLCASATLVADCHGVDVTGVSTAVPEETSVKTDDVTHAARQANASSRKSRARATSYYDFVSCALTKDLSCFLDVSEELVEERRLQLLAQADAEAVKVTGRADKENVPSSLADVVGNLFGEFGNIFRDSFSGVFGFGKEADDDDFLEDIKNGVQQIKQAQEKVDDENNDGQSENGTTSRGVRGDEEDIVRGTDSVEEFQFLSGLGSRADHVEGQHPSKTPRSGGGDGRGKKKKEKIKKIIKLVLLGAVLKAKITILLKLLAAHLQVKFFLVALAGLILNAARFYLDLKKGHQPQKVIYYEHAQHQHHYEGGEDDWHSSPGDSYWGRAYDEDDGQHGANLAYAKQKPTTSSSWF